MGLSRVVADRQLHRRVARRPLVDDAAVVEPLDTHRWRHRRHNDAYIVRLQHERTGDRRALVLDPQQLVERETELRVSEVIDEWVDAGVQHSEEDRDAADVVAQLARRRCVVDDGHDHERQPAHKEEPQHDHDDLIFDRQTYLLLLDQKLYG